MTVRTRFAPSPTGSLHIGGVRTALYCYALSQKYNGQFIVRIEDTDQTRLVEGASAEIFEMLNAYGIEPDESARHGGAHGPYIQSQRLDLYHEHAKQLVEKGAAYYCFLTDEEYQEIQRTNKVDNVPFRSPHRDLGEEEIQRRLDAGESRVVRQKIPENREIEFEDGVQGKMKFDSDEVDEGVLLKSDGYPTYHLAMLVDDHLMEISHVFRAAEWIPSIPKHVLLYEAMGWEMPKMYHLTTILDPEGGKLSKRKGSVAAKEFLIDGYLPQALLNFLMLLGWSAPIERVHGEKERELFSLEEFVQLFELENLNRSNPTFDREKLIWFNQQYLATLEIDKLVPAVQTWLATFALQNETLAEDMELLEAINSDEYLKAKLELVRTRVKHLSELPKVLKSFYRRPDPQAVNWDIKQLKRVDIEKIELVVADLKILINSHDDFSGNWRHESWEQGVRDIADKHEIKHGDTFMILRMAITGGPFSPPLFESLQILGKEEVLARLRI